jgi:hypothetical protein
MKKIINSIAIALLLLCFLPACKKDDNPLTTLQKIQGEWLLQSLVTNDHYSGADHISTQSGASSDKFDFRSDGNLYFTFAGTTDKVSYILSGDTKIIIDGTDTFDIKTLTSNSFVIYKKEFFGADYEEVTINLKR